MSIECGECEHRLPEHDSSCSRSLKVPEPSGLALAVAYELEWWLSTNMFRARFHDLVRKRITRLRTRTSQITETK